MFAGRGDKRRRRGGGGERSVLPEGTKRQRVARRQDASEANLQPMPEFMTAWAFCVPGFCGREVTERRRTELPRASASERCGSVPRSDTRPSHEQGSKRLARTESGERTGERRDFPDVQRKEASAKKKRRKEEMVNQSR